MHNLKKTSLLLLLLLTWLGCLPLVVQAGEPVVRAVLFWSEDCPHCHVILAETMPPLQEQYGDQLEVLDIEISDPAHYELWLEAMEAFQVPPERGGVPMLFIGDTVLIGSREIPERLPGLIEQHLVAGGVDYPAIPGLVAGPTLTPTPPAGPPPRLTPIPAPGPVVHFWLFRDGHCGACLTLVEDILPQILANYETGQVVVHQQDLEKGGYDVMRALEQQHGLEYGDMPEVFIGDQFLLGTEVI